MRSIFCLVLVFLTLVCCEGKDDQLQQPVYDWTGFEEGLQDNRYWHAELVQKFRRIQVIMDELVVFRDKFYTLPSLDVRSEEMVRVIQSTLVANDNIAKTFAEVGAVYDDVEKAILARDIEEFRRQMDLLPPLHDAVDINLDLIKSNLELIDVRQPGLRFKFKFSQPTTAPDLWGFSFTNSLLSSLHSLQNRFCLL